MTPVRHSIASRLDALPWDDLERSLGERGYARTGTVLADSERRALTGLWEEPARFRSRVEMARHRFGEGEYRYFADPLPPLVRGLREAIYPRLAPIASRWMELLGRPERYAPRLESFLAECARAGQSRPTPLLLRYQAGGYNCLHQDLYGEVAFPLQVVAFLSRPGADYEGGEFLLVETRPRAQSAGEAVLGLEGELLIFTTRFRPARGQRGHYKVQVRHGVSRVRAGIRFTMGLIFHNAS